VRFVYPACFYPCEEGGFTVTIPDLPGAVTEGDTLDEAMANAMACACGWILEELDADREAPSPSSIDSIECDEPNGIKSYLFVDLDAFGIVYGKNVRKNVTLPAWLNIRAERAKVNYSEVLREALEKKLFSNKSE